jgi:hypothetical protein
MPYSGKWPHVVLVYTDVSEKCVASIFMVEEITRRKKKVRLTVTVSYRLTLFLARVISSTLNMLAMCSSETSVYNTRTRRHIPEVCILLIAQVLRGSVVRETDTMQ